MQALICPQCGGRITEYAPEKSFTVCGYCSTRFLIKPNTQAVAPPPPVPEPDFESFEASNFKPQTFMVVLGGVFLVFGLFAIVGLVTSRKTTNPPKTIYGTANPLATPSRIDLPPTPNPNLLEFGGKGTANGLFKDSNTIAVDKQGHIYVGDDSLRVQHFDEKGKFVSVIQVPEKKTANYRKARTIDKIAVADDGKLYVAAGGAILIFDGKSDEPYIIHAAPDYIQDFALKSDGSLLLISNNDEIETLIFVNKARRVTRRINGFHTDAADAALSPGEAGLAAIRIAVDGAGNIFSVYAFGDLGSYTLNYNADELLIFRFTPEGKYVNKFVQSMNSCGIAVDNQSRIYVSNGNIIDVHSNTGQQVSVVLGLGTVDAFALDKNNNVYVLSDDTVVKRPAIK